MHLSELKLVNFKNCDSAELQFVPKLNCFVGLNGAGKTNVLDAIYYLSFCKSFFNAADKLNIKHGQDFFAIHGMYCTAEKPAELVACVQKRDAKKSFKHNKKEYERLSDHIGKYPLVMVSPYDRDLINDGSEQRRRFIDMVISQFDALYLETLIKYNKVLAQRNEQLKRFQVSRTFDRELLQIWEQQQVDCAETIFTKRKEFLGDFLPIFQRFHDVVSDGGEKVDIEYCSSLSAKSLVLQLEETLMRDRESGYTGVGIHKDDLMFSIDGHPLKKFGSQGQQKSFVVALRLAQFEYSYHRMGYKPILLFDDIFDKLDDRRVAKLVHLVGDDHFGQVFITDTQRSRVEYLFENTSIQHRIFEVTKGTIQELNENE